MQRALSLLSDRIAADATGSWTIHRLGVERSAAGHDVIMLSLGEPDSSPPATAAEAAVDGILGGRTRYSRARGEARTLEAVAARVAARVGCEIGTDRVVFFPGSQAALFATMLCLVDQGDEMIVPDPAYATYPGVLAAVGARLVAVSLRPEDGFHLRPGDVADAVTARTRAILVTSPHNPTGTVMTRDELEELAVLCRERGLWLVADEVYAELTHGRPHVSVLALDGAQDFAVSLGSLSKSHAMTGFRAGGP